MQNVSRDQAAAEIKSSFELRGAIAAFELTTRRLLIANRDMRLAMDGKQVNDRGHADPDRSDGGRTEAARAASAELGNEAETRSRSTASATFYGQLCRRAHRDRRVAGPGHAAARGAGQLLAEWNKASDAAVKLAAEDPDGREGA